jgi:hypothetical protein
MAALSEFRGVGNVARRRTFIGAGRSLRSVCEDGRIGWTVARRLGTCLWETIPSRVIFVPLFVQNVADV